MRDDLDGEPADRDNNPVRKCMGATVRDGGVVFRVWAPYAERVAVAGDFNDWSPVAHPLAAEEDGYWSADVHGAMAGDEYKFVIQGPAGEVWRKDPYSRDVDHSTGNSIVVDPSFDWSGDEVFQAPPWHRLVIYEMHIGAFNDTPGGPPGDLRTAIERLPHLVELGVNAIELMPIGEFPGDQSWGYNPADIFAVETAYGGTKGLKAFIKAAHAQGLAVIIDVVYNHLGPSDLDLWQFDGWHENGKGGIYFYNDWRAGTPWGETRPNYSRPQVRKFLRDNALFWIDEFRVDGLRFDMTLYIRTVYGDPRDPGQELPEGWAFMRWVNAEINACCGMKLTIAEDLQDEPAMTRVPEQGGAGFRSQWAANFVGPVRAAIITQNDDERSMSSLRDAILGSYNGDALQRVIYTESHDEAANGRLRVPLAIAPNDAGGWHARKRSTLGTVLVFTSPGIAMLIQGQEFLEDQWLHDADMIDWAKKERFVGIFRLYRTLISLRRNLSGRTRGLTGQCTNVFHVNDHEKLIGFHRWDKGGPCDDVVVVLNFANRAHDAYPLGFPRAGQWRIRLNSDDRKYGDDYGGHPGRDVQAEPGAHDGLDFHGDVSIGPYSALIFSQEADG